MQEVMDQLQQIPLLAEEPTSSSDANGARPVLHAKRARLGASSSKPPTGSPSKSSAVSHLRGMDAMSLPAAALVGGSSSSSMMGAACGCSSPLGNGSNGAGGISPSGGAGVAMGRGRMGVGGAAGWGGPGSLCGMHYGAHGGEHREVLDARTDSINAMMHVTVVETLGFN
jgi:hypothetical protein